MIILFCSLQVVLELRYSLGRKGEIICSEGCVVCTKGRHLVAGQTIAQEEDADEHVHPVQARGHVEGMQLHPDINKSHNKSETLVY